MRAVAALIVAAGLFVGQPADARQPAGRVDAERLRAAAARLPQLHTLRVSHRGVVVAEYDDRPSRRTAAANIKSASKSLIAALVGIAIAEGRIERVETPIARWFPEVRTAGDSRKRSITVENLLAMQSGL